MIRSKQLKSAVAAGVLLIASSGAFASIMSGSSLPDDGLSPPSAGATDPAFVFSIDLMGNDATATLDAIVLTGGAFLATSGTLHVTAGADVGTYSLVAGGPGAFDSPSGAFVANDVLYPGSNPLLDAYGLLFTGGGLEINIFGNSPNNYSFASGNGSNYNVEVTGTPDSVSLQEAPEPGTLALLGIGLALLGAGLAKQRRNLS